MTNTATKNCCFLNKCFEDKTARYLENGFYCTTCFVVQSLSHVWLFATPWTAAHQAPLASTISQSLLKFLSIVLVILSSHLILCHLLLLLPSIFPRTRVFSNKLALRELPDVQAGFRKGRGTRDQIANIHWIVEKAREFHLNLSGETELTPCPLGPSAL